MCNLFHFVLIAIDKTPDAAVTHHLSARFEVLTIAGRTWRHYLFLSVVFLTVL